MSFDAPAASPIVAVTWVGAAEGARGAAAALACLGADADRASLLVDLDGRAPRPTLLATTAARALEERLAAHFSGARVAARGQVCHLVPGEEGIEAVTAAATVARGGLVAILVSPERFQGLLAEGPRLSGVMLRAEIADERPLLTLVVRDLLDRGLEVAVLKRRLGWVEERRALFGVLGESRAGLSPSSARRLVRPYVAAAVGVGAAA